MKRITTALAAMVAGVALAWSTITVSVPVQLLNGQSNLLPDKTIEATFKQVKYKDSAPAQLRTALDSLCHIVTDNAGLCRTFAVRFTCDYSLFSITNIDPLDMMQPGEEVAGTIIVDRCHFLVIRCAANADAVKASMKTEGEKIKYVREFEFVDEQMEPIVTCVEAQMEGEELKVTRCIVDGFEID